MKKCKWLWLFLLVISLMVGPTLPTVGASGATDYWTDNVLSKVDVNLYSGMIPPAFFGDILYYDVCNLTPAQINAVSGAGYFSRGTVLVYKTDGTVVIGSAAEAMVKSNQVRTMVVPGVGSSPYGTLAMAKQFSQIMNRPVAGLVAGVGSTVGVMADGPEGYFIGRNSNEQGMSYDAFAKPGITAFDGGYAWKSLWKPFHWINNAFLNGETVGVGSFKMPYIACGARAEWYACCGWEGIGAVWKSSTANTPKKLAGLMEQGFRPDYLIGHSKGDMDVASALYLLKEKGKSSLYRGVKFVGFGMTVNVPSGVKAAQYLGSLDSLGGLNSVRDTSSSTTNNWITFVPGKTHSLNQNSLIAPTHMPVATLMGDVKSKLGW